MLIKSGLAFFFLNKVQRQFYSFSFSLSSVCIEVTQVRTTTLYLLGR